MRITWRFAFRLWRPFTQGRLIDDEIFSRAPDSGFPSTSTLESKAYVASTITACNSSVNAHTAFERDPIDLVEIAVVRLAHH